MKRKIVLIIFTFILVTSLFIFYSKTYSFQKVEQPDFFFGLDVAYENIEEIKVLVNEVRSYTNLFVVGCTGITHNTPKLDDTYSKYIFWNGTVYEP